MKTAISSTTKKDFHHQFEQSEIRLTANVKDFKFEIVKEIHRLDTKIDKLQHETRLGFAAVRSEMAAFKTEIRAEISAIKADIAILTGEMKTLKNLITMVGIMIPIVAAVPSLASYLKHLFF